MFLHNDKELFQEVIVSTAEDLGVVVPIIEKDYYVTMILKKLSVKCPECVFKGGTSLSKCHKIIKRFSEDIDLTIEYDLKPSEGTRRNLKKSIVAAIEKYDFELANKSDVKSRREYMSRYNKVVMGRCLL